MSWSRFGEAWVRTEVSSETIRGPRSESCTRFSDTLPASFSRSDFALCRPSFVRAMNFGATFWKQPTTGFRNAQLLFSALTVIFGVASVVYAVFPTRIAAGFAQLDLVFGGSGLAYPEPQCRIWISLAAANVATLSLLSFGLLKDLKRNRAMHLPLLFMKTASALLFLGWFFAFPDARSLLIAFVGDFFTGVAIWWLPRRAFAELEQNLESKFVSILGS